MKHIEYRITYADGVWEITRLHARNINSGFGEALRRAKQPLGNGVRRDIHSIEFSQVLS